MKLIFLLAVPAVMSSPVSAREPDPRVTEIDELLQCRTIVDNTLRGACYDEKISKLKSAIDRRSVVILNNAEIQSTRRSLFGFTLPKLPFLHNDSDPENTAPRASKDDQDIRQLETVIKQVRTSGYGLWVFTLAEGGVWRTTQSDSTFSASPGAKILIKKGPLGGYMANVNGQRAVRVERSR